MSKACLLCGEEITLEDVAVFHSIYGATEPQMHVECLFRSIVGSVAHIDRRCSCYVTGSQDNDPPGLTARQAAREAVLAYRAKHGAGQ